MVIKNLCPDGVTPIWNKSQMESLPVEEYLPAWVRTNYSTFVETVHDPAFPCFWGTIGEQKGMIRYVIASSLTEPSVVEHTLEGVYNYINEVNENELLQHENADLLTLVIFFPPEPTVLTVEEYSRQAFEFLNALHSLDAVSCPCHWSADPQSPNWSYSLGGCALFVSVSTPANQRRRSRHLGSGMTFVITPVEVLLRKHGGENSSIFRRVREYDGIPPHPNLLIMPGSSKVGNELTVQVLPDDNDSEISFDFQYKFKD
jgi:FPC/CPF motif-containing protein YcgG